MLKFILLPYFLIKITELYVKDLEDIDEAASRGLLSLLETDVTGIGF
jgi:hypothetical protein